MNLIIVYTARESDLLTTEYLQGHKMVASSQTCGHQNKFLEEVSEEFRCRECKNIARNISMAVCCGDHYCQSCISPYHENNKPCPGCGQEKFSIVPHVRYRKSILALEVSCSMKDRGCGWTGKLQDLEAHLDIASNNCRYVDVECPNKCDQPIQRREMPDHLENYCPKRDYNCGYCGFTGSYEVVCNDHYPECDSYPIPCPNSCTVVSIERGTLDMHLKMCSYQEVECDVIGCGEKFMREAQEKHMDKNMQKHVMLMAVATKKLYTDTEILKKESEEKDGTIQKLQADTEVLKKKSEEKDGKIQKLQADNEVLKKKSEEKDGKIQRFEKQLQEKEQHVEALEKRLKLVEDGLNTHVLPVLTLRNYAEQKTSNSTWLSPAFYTHFMGYKLCLKVRPNGVFGAHNNSVTVRVCSTVGEYDDSLEWPASFYITVALINQHDEHSHYSPSKDIQWSKPKITTQLGWVTSGSVFISHPELEWNPANKTQYLKDDCLQFRIEVKKKA